MSDEFYSGWQAQAAPGTRRTLRWTVGILLPLVALLAVALAVSQGMIGASVFEWGTLKNFSGTRHRQPYPHLLVARPSGARAAAAQNAADTPPTFSAYYRVAPWKFGLSPATSAAFEGRTVALQGTLIYRDNQTMIEVVPDSIHEVNALPRVELPAVVALGRQTLVGEIVDSKCFLGVMNPGQLAPHRACAIRCISGGVPPLLVVRRESGSASYLLLVSAQGKPVNQQVLDRIAEPLEITGEVERQGEMLILRADPSTYRRLN